jgi:RimJ/RimL family protein N-acetyltransferase
MDLTPITGTADQCAFLYRLLQERPPEANISHREMPTYDAHCAFVHEHPYSAWYLIGKFSMRAETTPVGAIYLTKADEIGIAIHRREQGNGYAQLAIRMLMDKHPRKRYLANVAPGNVASHKLFSKLGKVIQHTYSWEATCR